MSLVALDGMPLVVIGGLKKNGWPCTNIHLNSTAASTVKSALILIGQIFTEDGSSHTIDTTGSSSIGFRTNTVSATWNAATVVKVGLAPVDTGTGPPGRASNVSDVISFDVNGAYTGGAAPTATAWNEIVPSAGTKTIANGDLVAFAIQTTTQGGSDTWSIQNAGTATGIVAGSPSLNLYNGATYTASGKHPNVVITFSDGKLGFFANGFVASLGSTTQTWNNSSSPNEYGNFFQLPVPVKVYGLIGLCSMGGDTDWVLYSDPLGTPAAQKTVSFDLNTVGGANTTEPTTALFSSPYTTTANQPLAGILKPSSATNISSLYATMNASAHQKAHELGANCYAVNRASGAFAAQNSNKDRFALSLLVGAFDAGGDGTTVTGVIGG